MQDAKALSPAEALYRDVVLEHYRRPRNRARLTDPDASALARNPLCGDQVEVEVQLQSRRVHKISARTRGCSIAVAAASIMTDLIPNLPPEEVEALHAMLKEMLETGTPPKAIPRELRAFEQISQLESRKRCALLPWEALFQALDNSPA